MRPNLIPVRTSAPAAEILSLGDVKDHLRVDHTDEDVLITALIARATTHLDGYSGILCRGLITQTWQEKFAWFDHKMRLRLGPVQSVTSVEYYDNDEVLQTVDPSVYRLHEEPGGAYLVQRSNRSWPSTYSRDDAVTITYVVGYGDAASDVPESIRGAALMLVAHWFEYRGVVSERAVSRPLEMAVEALIAPYRRGRYGHW